MIGPQFPEEGPTRVPERTLREFGGIALAMGAALFAWSWYRHGHGTSAPGLVALVLGVLIGIPGVLWPNSIRPAYLAAMAVTKPIGHVVSLAFLAIVYYGVLTPLALAFRLSGRDALLRRHRDAQTHWVDRIPTADVRDYLKQYQRQVESAGALDRASSDSPGISGRADSSPYDGEGSGGSDRNGLSAAHRPASPAYESPQPQPSVGLRDHHSLPSAPAEGTARV
jgi:hypothetical protein